MKRMVAIQLIDFCNGEAKDLMYWAPLTQVKMVSAKNSFLFALCLLRRHLSRDIVRFMVRRHIYYYDWLDKPGVISSLEMVLPVPESFSNCVKRKFAHEVKMDEVYFNCRVPREFYINCVSPNDAYVQYKLYNVPYDSRYTSYIENYWNATMLLRIKTERVFETLLKSSPVDLIDIHIKRGFDPFYTTCKGRTFYEYCIDMLAYVKKHRPLNPRATDIHDVIAYLLNLH